MTIPETKTVQPSTTLEMMGEMPAAAQEALVNIAQGIIIGYELRQKEEADHDQ